MKEERGKKKVESRKWKVGNLFLVVLFLLSACSTSNVIESHEAWVRSANQGEITVVYMILHNHTSVDDALIGISTDVAEAAELHLSEVQNDVMTMTPQEKIEILAGGEVILESGGYHIMLINLKQDLNVGDEITITLHFENYPDVTVNVPVQEAGGEEHGHP
ncbi:MAG TPA: copper chaperone PCu(A)C [Anaerolineales bacterium]|nr:copper chaperone PCu(A)C [Anaerolineales bacterium]